MRPLISTTPWAEEQRVCHRCSTNLWAPQKIVQLSQDTRTWPRLHQQIFDAALQRGSSRFGDLTTLRSLAHYQPFLPATFDLSKQGLADLHRWVLDTENIPVAGSYRFSAAAAVYRAKLELYGPPLPGERYRLCLNRQPLTRPLPAAEILLDFCEKELPALDFASSTIVKMFYALRKFFAWLAEVHPDVTFLRHIRPDHFAAYRCYQEPSTSAMRMLSHAWKTFTPFAAACGQCVSIRAIPWDDVKIPTRNAPVYADARTLFQALNAMARNDREPPFHRMLAHVLMLAAPSHEEISQATIPAQTADGIQLVRCSLLACRRVIFPYGSISRGRQENYRHTASATAFIPLRAEQEYLALYDAVDAARQVILHGTDCAFLFVSARQRVFPKRPIGSNAINRMLHQLASSIGFPDLRLDLLRNSLALLIAKKVSPRPAAIATATGRSFGFAINILGSMDLDPLFGLKPLPKVALVRDYGQSRS